MTKTAIVTGQCIAVDGGWTAAGVGVAAAQHRTWPVNLTNFRREGAETVLWRAARTERR